MTYIIAEVGSNWDRSDTPEDNLNNCMLQIKAAKDCGADAVKFQLFTHKELYGFDGEMAGELSPKWIPQLAEFCSGVSIDFMCSAFSVEGYQHIDKYVEMHKIAHSERNDGDIRFELDHIAKEGDKRVLVSGDEAGTKFIIPMACVAKYPAVREDYYDTLHINANYWWGLSDHTIGNDLALLAKHYGATYFEKHFDGLSELGETADSATSANVTEFRSYVKALRADAPKPVNNPHTRTWIATRNITIGDVIDDSNSGSYRPKLENKTT